MIGANHGFMKQNLGQMVYPNLQLLTLNTLITKVVGICFIVDGGLIIGKEGSMAHAGSILANFYSHLLKLSNFLGMPQLKVFRNDNDKRNFVSSGAAAGVAAAFGAQQVEYYFLQKKHLLGKFLFALVCLHLCLNFANHLILDIQIELAIQIYQFLV